MSARPLTLAWNPIRAFAALFLSAVVAGGLAVAGAFALLAGTLVLNMGSLAFQALVAGAKVLLPLALGLIILTGALAGIGRRQAA